MGRNAKIAMLQSLANAEHIPLPYAVAYYIATATPTLTSQELEGFLIRLVAYASLTGQEITIQLAREMLERTFGEVAH